MRKYLYSSLFILISYSFSFAQVPNGGFETWTAGSPDGWLTNNVPGIVTPVTQSSSSHSGSSAAKGEVVDYLGSIIPPILFSTDLSGRGFPITARYNSMKVYLRYSPAGGDSIYFYVGVSLNGEVIGAGIYATGALLNNYTEINIPIEYAVSGTPDTAIIAIVIDGPNEEDPHVGSEFYVDDITLSEAVVGVDDNHNLPASFNLQQNFPNPFNPSTSISYQIPERSYVTLKVYDILGNEVAELVNGTKEAGIHSVKFDAASLPSGVYIYSIKAGNYTSTKKMMLTK